MRILLLVGLLLWGYGEAATYTEAQRLKIWKALDAAEVQATKTADLTYPISCIPLGQPEPTRATIDANSELMQSLTEKLQNAILKKYKLSKKQFRALQLEGFKKHWPQIEYAPPGC
jgi:hypothetical protein